MLDKMLISKHKNKKANIWIVLLVFLDLFVVSASLYIFVTSSWAIEEKIYDAGVINQLHEKENIAEFYINDAGEKAIIESYKALIEDNKYIKEPIVLINNVDPKFKELSEELNRIFTEKFDAKFKENFMNYGFDDEYLKDLREIIYDGKFSRDFNGAFLRVLMSGFELNKQSEKINISYFPVVSADFNLTKIGLESFQVVYNAKEECKRKETAELIKECFKINLKNFDIIVEEKTKPNNEKYFLTTLTSKKEFLIDDEFRKIVFSFVPN